MHDDAIFAHFAVAGALRAPEADVEDICFRIKIQPHLSGWKTNQLRNRSQNPSEILGLQFYWGHSLFFLPLIEGTISMTSCRSEAARTACLFQSFENEH